MKIVSDVNTMKIMLDVNTMVCNSEVGHISGVPARPDNDNNARHDSFETCDMNLLMAWVEHKMLINIIQQHLPAMLHVLHLSDFNKQETKNNLHTTRASNKIYQKRILLCVAL